MPDGTIANCYAEDVATNVAQKAYPHGFEHHYWNPAILDEPLKLKTPARIFVGSMADVFGHWVPNEEIEAVLDMCRRAHWHTFQMLTKNPVRVQHFDIPDNVWIGASTPPTFMWGKRLSIEQQRRMLERTFESLSKVKAKVRWISAEPLAFDFSDLFEKYHGVISWVVIGAASSGPKYFPPRESDVRALLDVADKHGIRIFFKGNMKSLPMTLEHWREDFPTVKGSLTVEPTFDTGMMYDQPALFEAETPSPMLGKLKRGDIIETSYGKPAMVLRSEKTYPSHEHANASLLFEDGTFGHLPENTLTLITAAADVVLTEFAGLKIGSIVGTEHSAGTLTGGYGVKAFVHGGDGKNRLVPVSSLTLAFDTGTLYDQPQPAPQRCVICASNTTSTSDDKPLCASCAERIEAYQTRVQSRLERMHAAADAARTDATRDLRRAEQMASIIPFGQPILKGHHSEKWDTSYRNRIDRTWRRGFEKLQRAKDLEQKAASAENHDVISSDDPQAILKLQAKITAAEAEQAHMKQTNAALRKVMRLPAEQRAPALIEHLHISQQTADKLLQGDYRGRVGYPDYQLTNNNANIRRMKQRLSELQAQVQRAASQPEQETYGDVTLIRDTTDNRIRLQFPGKPDAESITLLKRHGFHWSPSNDAWQRQLSSAGERAVTVVLAHLGKVKTAARTPIRCDDCGKDMGTPEERATRNDNEVIVRVHNGDVTLCGPCFSRRNGTQQASFETGLVYDQPMPQAPERVPVQMVLL